ncbi:cold shock and DUF1294 domain-containing protein [Aromatoleum petrolei]|uniref:DUF1294 domain-containing protein n=1 Tax=Aromatoleum petrolei TaxID=76116 RepID=A0ABX1MYI2_9RHOO|nr:cold shock and DUF1294 domain-containing protein [Aromatoleum petrolei]NMF90984.1 DUF1294 domain-containing protein [Aromatoleum petrolei]QTQ36744.1 Cold shock-like protein [Aromatoleum petrolei]
MRIDGTVKTWNDDRGFGFIEPLHGGQEIFVHIKAFVSRSGRPEVGQSVTFEVEMTPDGKKRAKRVEVVRGRRQSVRVQNDNPAQWGTATLFAIPAFFVLFTIVAYFWKVPGWVAGLYLGTSVVCYVVYAADKRAATADRWRVSEDTLLGLGLIGGWPGAIVAQQVVRHKSNKATFRAKFWVTVIVNVLAFLVLSSPLRAMLLA